MERPPFYAALIITALVLGIFAVPTSIPIIDDPASSSESPRDFKEAADDDETIRIHVLEEEAVMDTHPDQNYDGNTNYGGLWVGLSSEPDLTRSFLKFDVGILPEEFRFESATLNAYMSGELGPEDVPIAVHRAGNNWSETSITWNTQPEFSPTPTSVIDSPASPDTFVPGNWYSWDITEDVKSAILDDGILSFVMKATNESGPIATGNVFAEDEYNHFNASFIAVRYSVPSVSAIAVDGHDSAPLIDYVQDPTPTVSWTTSDPDPTDRQFDYEVQISDRSDFTGFPLWTATHDTVYPVMVSNDSSGVEPFGISSQMRFQFKYSPSLLNQSGTLDKIMFHVNRTEGVVDLENLVVVAGCTTSTGDLGTGFDANFAGCTPVTLVNSELYEAQIVDGRLIIDVDNLLVVSQDMALIIEIRFTNSSSTGLVSFYDSTPGLGSVAYVWGSSAYENSVAFFTDPFCYSMDLTIRTSNTASWAQTNSSEVVFGLATNSSGTVQFKYDRASLDGTGLVDRIFFHVNDTTQDVTLENLTVTLAETSTEGPLSGDLSSNFNPADGVTVLARDQYTLKNRGGVLVLDVESAFYYSGLRDLLIQIVWDCKSGGVESFIGLNGSYSAWNFVDNQTRQASVSWAPDIAFDFIHTENEVQYQGSPLPEATRLYVRVRVLDGSGIWSSWTQLSFKYEPITEGPQFEGPRVNPAQVVVGDQVEITLNVTFVLGVSQVLIEIGGNNITMSQAGDRYSYSFVTTSVGTITFTVFMESAVGTWSVATGAIYVLSSSPSSVDGGTTLTIIIAGLGAAGAAIVVIFFIRKKGTEST
ncbi:MAG: DNRLRE domain-containing protein [Candidatus Thorarchaeota archaeon]